MANGRLARWAHTVRTGTTVVEPDPSELHVDWTEASYKPRSYRTRKAMIAYAKARNAARWKRLNADYAWLKQMMEEMGMNPEDAKTLL